MKGKTSKIVLVLASLFFGVFFFFNTAFAETGDKGIIVEGFYYNENDELTFAWSVDAGFNEWRKSYLGSSVDIDYINLSYNDFVYLDSWYWSRINLYNGTSDCDEFIDGYSFSVIHLNDFGSKVCSVRFKEMSGAYFNPIYTSNNYLTKTEIENVLGAGKFESGALSFVDYMFKYKFSNGSGSTYDIDYPENPFTAPSGENWFPLEYNAVTNGVCGDANGSTFDWADYNNQDFCSAGDFYYTGGEFNGNMLYSCVGTGGGTTDRCSASYYINGDCGTLNGTTQASISIENENLCSYTYLYLLDETSFSSTATGWSWICNGLYGGYDSFCTADKSDVVFPDVPELEDCSSYTFPNNWICSINNTLQSAFLPSAEKINELNLSINAIQQKAPFNYLNLAKTKITELTNNITQDGLSMSILGNTSTINENALTTLADNVKKFFTFLLMLAFLFWGINYIKHFFR